MKSILTASLACSVLALSACADGDFGAEASRVEGIYRVDSHTLNVAACAPGGDAQPDQHGFAFAVRNNVFGIEMLDIYSCESIADCRAKAQQRPFQGALIDFDFTLTSADGAVLLGEGASTGWSDGETCAMPEVWDTTLELNGTSLRIERAIRIGEDYPVDAQGYCTTDLGREMAEDEPCSQMEVLTATRLEPL